MEQKLEIGQRTISVFVQVILELPSPAPSTPGLAWGVCPGGWQEVSLTLRVLEDLLSASSMAGTRSHLQEPEEGCGPSCPLERWQRPGGPSLQAST